MSPESRVPPARHSLGDGGSPKSDGASDNRLRLVFWETTAACNLHCRHCRRLDEVEQGVRDELGTAASKKLIDQIAEVAEGQVRKKGHGTRDTGHATNQLILVMSGGEPLMRQDIFELARYAVDKGLTVALATNGTTVDGEKARLIKESGIKRVSVSLDGAIAATHDAFRGEARSFERALEGFRLARKAGVEAQINFSLARANEPELPQLYELALREGAVALHIFMLVPVGCGLELSEEDMVGPEDYERVMGWIYEKSREGRLPLKVTCGPHYYRVIRERAREKGEELTVKTHGMEAVTRGCLGGISVCFVSSRGEVFPCGYLPVKAGDVTEESLRHIWESSAEFAKLRDYSLLTGKCGVCGYRKVCGGCRARAYVKTGDMLAEEPFCAYIPEKK